jgi:CheY-like chemotaxis protein
VIAITANALQGDDQRCLAAGMNDYVTKPVDRARLLGKVSEWGYRAA